MVGFRLIIGEADVGSVPGASCVRIRQSAFIRMRGSVRLGGVSAKRPAFRHGCTRMIIASSPAMSRAVRGTSRRVTELVCLSPDLLAGLDPKHIERRRRGRSRLASDVFHHRIFVCAGLSQAPGRTRSSLNQRAPLPTGV
jgi:hypothetical protein